MAKQLAVVTSNKRGEIVRVKYLKVRKADYDTESIHMLAARLKKFSRLWKKLTGHRFRQYYNDQDIAKIEQEVRKIIKDRRWKAAPRELLLHRDKIEQALLNAKRYRAPSGEYNSRTAARLNGKYLSPLPGSISDAFIAFAWFLDRQ
jgi:restriction endonuclease